MPQQRWSAASERVEKSSIGSWFPRWVEELVIASMVFSAKSANGVQFGVVSHWKS
jgi:hypothetical protein